MNNSKTVESKFMMHHNVVGQEPSVTEINTNTVASIIEDDRHLSTRTLASLMNMLKMSTNRLLTQELKFNLFFPLKIVTSSTI